MSEIECTSLKPLQIGEGVEKKGMGKLVGDTLDAGKSTVGRDRHPFVELL